uniref:Ig-like domain-containing protein n=1 Tax=Cyprinus carpio carpio TaxID=630221 RepID=A0A8C1E545_CYPCA
MIQILCAMIIVLNLVQMVTGYQGHDVTLLCQYIHGSTEDKIQQVQWTWQNQSSKYQIMVFHMDLGLSMHETPLKDRVSFSRSSPSIDEVSIIIKDVKISDQGVYSCDYTIFPSGTPLADPSTDSPPVLSTAEAVGIVTAVVIITLVITVVGYLFLRNRRYVTTKHLVNASKYDRFMPTAN